MKEKLAGYDRRKTDRQIRKLEQHLVIAVVATVLLSSVSTWIILTVFS